MKLSICNTITDSKGRELLEHGTALFPVSCYEDDLIALSVPWHWHDEFEVLYVTEGRIHVSVGTDQYTLSTGDGVFINSGILHSVKSADTEKSEIHSIVFHPRIVGGGVDSIYWQKYVHPIILNPMLRQVYLDHSEIWHEAAIKEIETAWNIFVAEKPGYEFDIRTSLSSFIFRLSQSHPQNAKRPSEKIVRDNERLKGMLLFIQQNYASHVTVSMLAESVLISESECMRCFRSTMGISPIKYLKQFRLQKAADLLSTTNAKIIDIGLSCGFQDTSYFIKSFKKMYGSTPNEFQKKNNQV
ncbi:MAG: AraC family transcriptional regulator [Lachnospiraceae bacterium]|nr:AraC family transcriptional regulator [Lachnospiraceae bacterium]